MKWYLSMWFIGLCFALSFLILPLFLGVKLVAKRRAHDERMLALRERDILTELDQLQTERNRLERQLDQERLNFQETIQKEQESFEYARQEVEREVQLQEEHAIAHLDGLYNEQDEIALIIESLRADKKSAEHELVTIEEELLYQSFGLYETRYNFSKTSEYHEQLHKIRGAQKQMIKDAVATNHKSNWQLDGDAAAGERMNQNNIRIALRSFNNESDMAIMNVQFYNIQETEKQIRQVYSHLNEMNEHNMIAINEAYLNLKLEELFLVHEFNKQKEHELKEQNSIRERLKVEGKAQIDLERKRKRLQRDVAHYGQVKERYQSEMSEATTERKLELQKLLTEVKEKLTALNEEVEEVTTRIEKVKAGYVYIVSNIGSFGEDVYKIGMTRSSKPEETIEELASRELPFAYDIHGLIYSEDAQALESELHEALDEQRVNLMNKRKQFFKANLQEIEEVVKVHHEEAIELNGRKQAKEWRKTQRMLDDDLPVEVEEIVVEKVKEEVKETMLV